MTGPAQGGVIITAADQYQEMKAIGLAVTQLTAKLDNILLDHNRRMDEHAKELRDHEDRLRELERRLWAAAGIIGIFSIVASGLVAHFLAGRQ